MNAISAFGQLRPVGDVDPVGDVLLEDLGRDLGVELVVDVLAAGLVLDERERVRQLADVVVVGRDAGQQRVGPDRLRRPLREVSDHQRVVVRPGRLDEQPAQQRLRRVGELEQLEHGHDPEQVAEDRERSDRRDRGSGRRCDRGADELEEAARVVEAEQRERRDDEDVRDGDREPRPDEDLEPVAAADRDDAGEPADEDVRRELELVAGLVHRPAEQGDDDRDQRRHAGVEEDRDEHAGGGRGHDERQAGPAGRGLEQQRRPDDDQPDQQQRVVAVPELAPEPPDPGEAERHDEDRKEQPAAEPGHVGAGVAEAVLVDDLELLRGDLVAAPDDRLVERDLDRLRLDRGRRAFLGGIRQLRAEERVRDDQRVDDRRRQRPLGVGDRGHLAREAGPGVLDLRLAQLGPLRGVEDARSLGADGGPFLGSQADERQANVVRDALEGRLEERDPLLVGGPFGEGLVDRPDALLEEALLILGDGDRPLGREVELEVDVVTCGVLELPRPDVADVLERPRGDDVGRGDAADVDPERLREEVGAEDRGQDEDQADRRGPEARFVAAAERCGWLLGSSEHRRASGSVAADVVRGEVGRGERLRDERAQLLAVGAATRPG